MRIREHWVAEPSILAWTLDQRPPIVASAHQAVHLFKISGPNIIDENAAGFTLASHSEGIAEAERVDRPASPPQAREKRVVARNAAVRVQAQNLAAQAIEVLSRFGIGLIADPDIELSIRTEQQGPAIVVGFPWRCDGR